MEFIIPSLLVAGFLFGVRHAFDADHIAAVSAIGHGCRSIKTPFLFGAFWGFGHAISLAIAGFVVLLFKMPIPEKIAFSFELAAGIMLVLLGINALMAIKENKVHLHTHWHQNKKHSHLHSHKSAVNHAHAHIPLKKPLFIGLVHGLEGSAAITLMALITIKSFWLGITYILMFGIGSLTGMLLISSIIYMPFALIASKSEIAEKLLKMGTGAVSMILGIAVIYNIGFA